MRFSAPPACPTNLPRDLSASLLFCFALLQQQWLLKSFPSLAALLCFACSVIVTYLPSPRRRPSPKSVQVGRPAAPRARAWRGLAGEAAAGRPPRAQRPPGRAPRGQRPLAGANPHISFPNPARSLTLRAP